MQVLDTAAVAGLVVVEIVAVETGKTVPCGHPDEAVVILIDTGDGITGQTVFCRIMGE